MSFKKTGGIGIPAKHYKKLIGKKLNKRIEKDFQFKWLNLE
jgi:hypothetical protein